MRVGDADRGDPARQRGAVRAPGLGLDSRHRGGGEARPPGRGRRLLRQRRAGQLRRPRAADGRLEGLGARARGTAPTGSASTPSASRCWSRPATRRPARPTCFPTRPRSPCRSARRSAPWRRASCSPTPSGGRCRSSATRSSRRSSRRPARAIPDGFWARAASHLGVPEAIELALLAVGRARGADRGPAPAARLARRARGWSPRRRRRPGRRSCTAFADSGPDGLAGITAIRGLTTSLHYGLPDLGTGRNPNWDAIGYPGPRSAPPDVPKPLRVRRPTSAEEVIEADVCVVGLRRRRRRGRRRARRRRQAGLRAGDGRLLQRVGLRPARAPGLPAPLPERGARSRPPRARCRSSPAPTLGGGTVDQLDQLPAHPPVGPRGVGARVRARGARRRRVRPPPRRRPRAPRRQRRLQRPEPGRTSGSARAASASGYDFRLTVRNADRDSYDPASAGYMGFGDQSGLEALDPEDLPARRPRTTAPTSSPTAAPSGSWSRTAAPPGSRRAGSIPSRRRRTARGAGSWSAPRWSSSPAARSSRPRCCFAPGSAAPPSASTCGCTRPAAMTGVYAGRPELVVGPAAVGALAPVRGPRGRLRLPGRVGAVAPPGCSPRPRPGAPAATTRSGCSPGAGAPPFINLTRDHGHGRVTVDDAGNPVLHYRLTDELDVAQLPPRARAS